MYLSLLICVGGGALGLAPELLPLLSDESSVSSEEGGARVEPGEDKSSFCKNLEIKAKIS